MDSNQLQEHVFLFSKTRQRLFTGTLACSIRLPKSLIFFLYIKKYATWCPLSQQTIVPTLTVGLTFNVYRISSVSSSSSRQSQTSAGGTACSRLPRLAVICPGSCSFPSEASPSSSALVRSPRRRPPVLSTWSTTERNKEMTVHGEDDSRDPAARLVIVFGTEKGINWVVRDPRPV